MNGFDACQFYLATKAHYTSDYSVLKYNWKVKLSEETFRTSKDRFLFERLAREYEQEHILKQAFGFYLYENPKAFPRGLIRPNPSVDAALERHADLFSVVVCQTKDGGIDEEWIIDRLSHKKLSPETACILMDFMNLESIGPKQLRMFALLPKYSAFVGYNKAEMSRVVMKRLK